MAKSDGERPIIIKRKKVVGGEGHHGGTWKVAYADFVTAMMAFFLMMWLLNATTEQQRKGLADYFSPTIPVTRISGGGDGSFGGDDVFSENTIAQEGTGGTDRRPTEGRQALGVAGTEHREERESSEDEALEAAARALEELSGDSTVSELLLRHVRTRLTDEGLVVEIYSREGDTLFDEDGTPADWLPELAAVVVSVFSTVTNDVAITGHVAAAPVVRTDTDPWAVSTARAEIMRRLLVGAGLDPVRMDRVTGHADRRPAAENRTAVRNDRIEVILLRNRV